MSSFYKTIMFLWWLSIFLSCLLQVQGNTSDVMVSEEKRLIDLLIDNYDRIGHVGRPVYNTTDTVTVKFGLALIQIYDLDEKTQVLTTKVWQRYMWDDRFLKWNPEDFGGVDHVRIPHKSIWKPDIVLYNSIDDKSQNEADAMAVVSADGRVMWIVPGILKSSCSVDITHFPFDEQSCMLKFGSWTYDGFRMDLDFYDGLEQVDTNDYIASNEWQLTATPAVKNVKYYPCCLEPYPDLTFTIRIKRMTAFYNYTLIVPSILLSILVLVIFWIHPNAGDRLIYGVGLFLAFFLLLLLVADTTPPAASSVPLLGGYIVMNMILVCLCTMSSVLVINMHKRGRFARRMPKCVRVLMLDFVGCVLLVKPCEKNVMKQRKDSSDRILMMPEKEEIPTGPTELNKDSANQQLVLILEEYVNFMKAEKQREIVLRKTKEQDEEASSEIKQEWKMLAQVLDRLFFLIYLIIDIAATVILM